MTKLWVIAMVAACAVKADVQNQCQLNHILFSNPTGKTPQLITTLGNNPQIKCLQNITDKNAFLQAIEKCKKLEIYKSDFRELDEILMQIGFIDGLDDGQFTAASLSYETIPGNTEGMLGYKKDKKK